MAAIAPMSTRKSTELTLTDKLSRLTLRDVNDLLGPDAKSLLNQAGNFEINLYQHSQWQDDRFILTLHDPAPLRVTILLDNQHKQRILYHCSDCPNTCAHVGAAFSLILEEKTALGLAMAPQLDTIEPELTDDQLVAREIQARRDRGQEEKMRVRSSDASTPWTDYRVSSKISGKTYRVALRGMQPGQSYCSCPDFRKNTLGVCKHIFNVQRKINGKFSAKQLNKKYQPDTIIVYLEYAQDLSLRVNIPTKANRTVEHTLKPFLNKPVNNVGNLIKSLTRLERQGFSSVVYPDAEEYIQQQLQGHYLQRKIAEIRQSQQHTELQENLLKVKLLPYQLEGILFAANAGRAILADDMGLGKTIQGIGTAQLLARIVDIKKVLVICPASLKSQWRSEITRFSDRNCQIVLGAAVTRASQYHNNAFFTICNYEQVLRDFLHIEASPWDLIILDEGHRIKNWQAKTSQIVKSLRSRFALVLSGTPMESRLDELYSVAEFINERRLGPGFRFYHQHRIVDEDNGRIIGFKNLAQLRENLKPILLRRTRDSVLSELPPRSTETLRVTPTMEQQDLHQAHMQTVLTIINKSYLSEMDLLRLQKALLMCRMCANSTFLVDKTAPGHSSKLELTATLLPQLAQEPKRKVVLFSEWTTMLSLIEDQLQANDIAYVRLDGSVPQQKRARLVSQFQQDDNCQFFLATNAGSTGLNLQFANTVVNVDLPWTPAILEQRIGRVHRMGQQQPVQVYLLVTESTLEENLLATLAAKHELALAALDPSSELDEVQLVSGMEALKRRLEVLLGAKPEAPQDETQTSRTHTEADIAQQRERMALAGGQLINSTFEFLATMLPASETSAEQNEQQTALAKQLQEQLTQCTSTDTNGRPQLTITLPDQAAIENLSATIARMVAVK